MRFQCSECGWTTGKWVGRCGECQAWGTVEEKSGPAKVRTKVAAPAKARPITSVEYSTAAARPTGVEEFDRVLGGGLIPGAVVLLAGEPGVGKSTLLLEVAAEVARATGGAGEHVLYVSGEESAGQIRLRAERVGALEDNLLLSAETDLGSVLGLIEDQRPAMLVVDSVQTLSSADVDGVPGGVTQVREVAAGVIRAAKAADIPTILVGHITKDGSIAGPRLLEHLVDVVCSFEGERHSRLRLLRAVKNRYGPTDEVGCFDMTEDGIEGLADPSGLFLSRAATKVAGTCLTVTQEGRRPMVVEIQSLMTDSSGGQTRRAVSGMDSSRIAMALAVLSKSGSFPTAGKDVFVATIGGAKVTEPAADLATCLSLASAVRDHPLYSRLVAIGEISLSGEIRSVPGIERRLSEAARLGIRNAVVPAGSIEPDRVPQGMKVKQCERLHEAIDLVMNS